MSVFARWRGMKKRSTEPVVLTPAQRGQIVQRVIVDGWTSAEAAAAVGVPERLVDAWVADYRRHGMASLRHVPRKTVAAEILRLWLGRPVRAVSRRLPPTCADFLRATTDEASPLDRLNDDRRDGGS